jgi:hypothetical protein
MADETTTILLVGSVLVILLIGLRGLRGLIRRYLDRNKVWVEIDTKEGKTLWRLIEPDRKGHIHILGGDYYPPSRFTMHSDAQFIPDWKPLWRYTQGDSRPLMVSTKYGVSANPGKPEAFNYLGHQMIPAETTEVYMKNKLVEDTYAARAGLMIVVVIIAVLILLAVLGLYARH